MVLSVIICFLFLHGIQDGTVRQHDMRVPHACRSDTTCPGALLQLELELSTLALSNLTPYQFVVRILTRFRLRLVSFR